MGAGIGDIRPHVVNLILNDGPDLGLLAPTPSTQTAILELVQQAINTGGIVVPGVGLGAWRVVPSIQVPFSGAIQIPAVTAVLNSAVPGTPPAVSGLVGDEGGNSANPTHTRAASPPTPAGALILIVVSIDSQTITAGPAGFQRLCSNFDGNTDARIEAWFKIAAGGESTFTFTADGANFWSMLVGVYTGVQENGVAAIDNPIQQPNGASPSVYSKQFVGPWPVDSLMIFAGATFGGHVQNNPPTASGGSNLVQQAGSTASEFWVQIEF